MTTIRKLLTYARIGINRGTGDDLQRKTGIRQFNQAMDLLEQGYPLDADIDNLPALKIITSTAVNDGTAILTDGKNSAVVTNLGKEDADMGPKATTPAGKNSGQTKPSNGSKKQPRPTAKPANSGRK